MLIKERYIYIGNIKTDYKVTDDGRIFSLKGDNKKELKLSTLRNGYLYVNLYINGQVFRDTVHRIVARAFIPNLENKPVVNHKDGNKTNNNVNNLEWSTYQENATHALYNNLTTNYGERSPLNKFSEDMIIKVCEMLMEGLQPKEISDIIGLSQSMVIDIKHQKIWKHITLNYDFPDRSLFNVSSKYPYKLKETIANLCRDGKSNKDIREALGLENTKAIKSMIDRVRSRIK